MDALLSCSVRELYRLGLQGQRNLHTVYDALCSSGLAQEGAVDDISRLYSIFDAAVDQGLGYYVHDYVVEVCADKYLTSNDPQEAYLLDGQCVMQWVQDRALATLQTTVRNSVKQHPLTPYGAAIAQATSKVDSVIIVLQSLDSGKAGRSKSQEVYQEARLLQQCLQVASWCLHSGDDPRICRQREFGTRESVSHWSRVAEERKKRHQQRGGSFLTGLQAAVGAPSYPFRHLGDALGTIFLSGSCSEAAWHTKLALFLYYLLDGGFIASTATFRAGFPTLPPPLVNLWEAQYHLDCAMATPRDPHLEAALKLLALTSGEVLPFQVVAALAALQQPEAALAAQRGRSTRADRLSLDEVATVVQVALQGRELAEAFAQARRHCSQLPGGSEQRAQHTAALIGQLAEWAAGASGVVEQQQAADDEAWFSRLLELPLDAGEEQALLQWLSSKAASHSAVSLYLPLYHLQRGRTAEAIDAYNRLSNLWVPDPSPALTLRRTWLHGLLLTAAKQLPPSQRALVVHSDPDLRDTGRPLLQHFASGGAAAAAAPPLHVADCDAQTALFLRQPLLVCSSTAAGSPATTAPSTPTQRRVRVLEAQEPGVGFPGVEYMPTPGRAPGPTPGPTPMSEAPSPFSTAGPGQAVYAGHTPFPKAARGSRLSQQQFEEEVLQRSSRPKRRGPEVKRVRLNSWSTPLGN